jgi:TRAP-type transport system periplasmic protein
VLAVVLAGACLCMAVSLSHAAEVIKLKFAGFHPPQNVHSILATQFCDEMKKRTNGRVEISYHPGGTLISGPRIFDGVIQGVADIGHSNTGYTRGRFPVSEVVLQQPLGIPSGWVGGQVADDFLNKFKPKEWDVVHVLFAHSVSPLALLTVKPVRTLEDLRGLKIRAISTDGDLLKALGAMPVFLDSGEVYEALRRGVLDGAYVSLETLKGFRYGEVIKYTTNLWQIGKIGIFYWVMNKDKWNSLPADIKKIFDEVTAQYKEKTLLAWNESDIEGREFFTSKGGQMITLSEAESKRWADKMRPVFAEQIKELISKGHTQQELDTYFKYLKERIDYWRKAEKERKIPTPFE